MLRDCPDDWYRVLAVIRSPIYTAMELRGDPQDGLSFKLEMADWTGWDYLTHDETRRFLRDVGLRKSGVRWLDGLVVVVAVSGFVGSPSARFLGLPQPQEYRRSKEG